VRHWFAFYVLVLAGACVAFAFLAAREPWAFQNWRGHFVRTFTEVGRHLKLLGLGIYTSLCSTFLPLPTGWIVAAVGTREAALTGELWSTVLLVGAVGAVGSTVANLNDYHLFTWMLRSKHIAKVRDSRTYRAAARWFASSPFLILTGFNLIPIPVDVIRMLAITFRYPRVPFAIANFIGRFVRYSVIAFVTYYWDLGWIAPVALLIIAVVLGAGRVLPAMAKRIRRRTPTKAKDVPDG